MASDNPEDDNTRTHVVLTKGTMVSHYRIIEKIGAGGMGEVFLAQDTELDRKVALKFLPPHLCQDEDCRKRFRREAQAVAKLNHPNIITIHEVSEYHGRPFFAMELVEGQSLRDMAKGKELGIDRIIELAVQICDGLGAAHEKEVVHRDIKPSNIVIDAYGRPKILDFGLAAIQGGEYLTKTGSTLGTVRYMSPEQVQGQDVDHRSDLFSLGVVLYELISGRTPFEKDNEAATLKAITQDNPEPLARYKSDIPDELQRTISKLLEKDSSLRYQHADGVISDLKRLIAPTQSSISVASTGKNGSLLKRMLIPALVLIVAVAVLVLKPWKFEVSPSEEVVAAENRLAIMYFDNLADPDDSQKLGEIATNLLITDLTESQYLDVVSSQHLYDILKLLGREGEKKIDQETATEVATKARAKWMLQGSILQVEPHLIVTSQLIDVESGSAVASQRITGEAGDNIFTLVDKLTVEVKGDLALPAAAQNEPDLPIADVTTHSPEAYRHYLEGLDHRAKFYTSEALTSFREALKFDSTFAMAYLWIGMLGPAGEGRRAMARALEYSDQVSEKDRWYIEAGDARLSEQFQEYIRQLERIVEHYPEEKLALFWLGLAYEWDEGIRCFERVIEIDPLHKQAYNQLAYSYQAIGEFEQALWALNRYIEIAPDEANPYDSRGEIYATYGQLDKAVESFKKALEIKPDYWNSARSLGHICVLRGEYDKAERYYHVRASSPDPTQRANGRADLVGILLHQGKFKEALRRLEIGIETDRIELGDSWPLVNKIDERYYIFVGFLNDYPAAMVEQERRGDVIDLIYPDSQPRETKYLPRRAFTYAASGNFDKADSLIQQMAREIDSTETDNLTRVRAYVEYEKGNFDSAVVLQERFVGTRLLSWVRRDLGIYYLKAGRLGDAVSVLEKCLKRYDGVNLSSPHWYVMTHYYLGQAYEESGWTDKAIEQYETFLDIWKNADEGLKSVEDARARLAKLKQNH